MSDDNEMILMRLRGVPARQGDWKDRFDLQNPQKVSNNDDELDAKDRRIAELEAENKILREMLSDFVTLEDL